MEIGGVTFERGQTIPWTVRLDFDPTKGPHMNVNVGKGSQQVKYAVQDSNTTPGTNAAKKYMFKYTNELNDKMGYDGAANRGRPEPNLTEEQMQQMLDNMKTYFGDVGTGPCA
jgi:hypothetical protein